MKGTLNDIAAMLAADGLLLRGGFAFGAEEVAPTDVSLLSAAAILLVGQRGAEPWPHFVNWIQAQPGPVANPLDSWSRKVIDAVALQIGARAAYPSDRPYLPFQQWSMRAEGLRASPLGILMHPEYGLWHAYRGALFFDEGDVADELRTLNQTPPKPIHLCDLCIEKPCRKACPVAAHAGAEFAYSACLSHVRSPRGGECCELGCLDRNACPYGVKWRYPADVQAFHMAAFAGM